MRAARDKRVGVRRQSARHGKGDVGKIQLGRFGF
jgi:hypothetical protein